MVVAKSKNAGRAKKTSKTARKPKGTAEQSQGTAKTTRVAGDAQLDRRSEDRRKGSDRRKKNAPVETERRKLQRRAKVNRRRQIDPTTCERDYNGDEIEFMNALDQYKRSSGRMFPTCSEILEVLKGLGYEKQDALPAEEQDRVQSPPSEWARASPEEGLPAEQESSEAPCP